MIKDNVFKSSNFYMSKGDILHLIFLDESGTPVTVDLVETSETNQPVKVVPGKVIIGSATNITSTSFTANWSFNQNTVGYKLDVSTSPTFTTFVTGYNGKDVGGVNTVSVTGLMGLVTYYYRVRAYNETGTGENSDTVTVTTLMEVVTDADSNVYTYVNIGGKQWTVQNLKTTKYADGTPIVNATAAQFNDWFLPSKLELKAMRDQLKLFGVGGFSDDNYWSSTESFSSSAVGIRFSDGVIQDPTTKVTAFRVRACRSFTGGVGAYALRDTGPAGGLIFHIAGTTYYEASPSDLSEGTAWSNIINTEIGASAQGTAIGTGQSNTTAIISQIGHTNSAAKLCDDLSVGGWLNNTEGAYVWYNNDIANKTVYGALYNHFAVKNAHGLAPTGWRVPTSTDWAALETALANTSVGGKIKETGTTHWITPNTGATNESGFTAVPGGWRTWDTGEFTSIGYSGSHWMDDGTSENALRKTVTHNSSSVVSGLISRKFGVSVRCVRDIA